MQKLISVLIIDKDKIKHDYNKINSEWFNSRGETSFKIEVMENCDKVEKYLHLNRTVDCIITIGENDYSILNNMSFEFRKKWIHFEDFDENKISHGILDTLFFNINRENGDSKVFSIFTCAYKTTKKMAERLYNSLLKQTYKNWNWWIIDDSPYADSYFSKLNDPRIHIIKNCTNHGNIGFNKHLIAMACDGDYLVEVDHDDELVEDCLEKLKLAFDTYQDCDFAYSYCIEEVDDAPIYYGDGFALGLGTYMKGIYNGKEYDIPITPDVNALSIRHIVGLPNHVRCWKKEFYHKIGGHNTELSVLDDMDILIRTILNGKTCKIPKFLYIQHEGTTTDGNGRGSSTQSKRMGEILRLGYLLKEKYDKQIHDFLLNNNITDPYWVEEMGFSNINDGTKEGTTNLNYTLEL